MKLTLHQQIYLETIHGLCKSHGHAHTKKIAEELGIKMPSVTEALRSLAEKDLINYQARKNITLTETGNKIASELEKRHNILADFFYNILGCPKTRSEEIACRVEHVIDEAFRERLAQFASFLREEMKSGDNDPIKEFQRRYNRRNSADEAE